MSLFALGSNPQTVVEPSMNKTAGSLGVFATFTVDNSARAVANADAPKLGPLTADPEQHNAAVLEYFEGAGLPSGQVENVHAMAAMRGTGVRADTAIELMANRELDSYLSSISRVAVGIPVPDSFAWARFQADGTVQAEAVHWPTIPGAVIADALALQSMLADPVLGPKLTTMLPVGHYGVVIRHSMAGFPGTSQVFAAVDVTDMSGLRGRIRHFDVNGNELTLNGSVGPTPPATPKP